MKHILLACTVMTISLSAYATNPFECASAIAVRAPNSATGKFYTGPTLNQFYNGSIDARVPGYAETRYYMKDKGDGVVQLETGSDTMISNNTVIGSIPTKGYLGLTDINMLTFGNKKISQCVFDVWVIACAHTAQAASAGLVDMIGAGNPIDPSTTLPMGCGSGQ